MTQAKKRFPWFKVMAVGIPLLILGGWLLFRSLPFGGPDVVLITQFADRAEVSLLETPQIGQPDDPARIKTTTGPIAVPEAMKKELARLLTSDSSYRNDGWRKLCEPTYYVKLRFFHGETSTDYYFCFQCDETLVVKDGMRRVAPYIDPSADQFIAIFHDLLPNDAGLLQLYREIEWDRRLGDRRFSDMSWTLHGITLDEQRTSFDLTDNQEEEWLSWLRGLDPYVTSDRSLSADKDLILHHETPNSTPYRSFRILVSLDEKLIQFPSENGGEVTIKFDDQQKQRLIAFLDSLGLDLPLERSDVAGESSTPAP